MEEILKHWSEQLGVPVSQILPVEDGFIVLFDYRTASQKKVWDTLLRIRTDGTLVWRVGPKSLSDRFVSVKWEGKKLLGWTWECYSVTVDPGTGKVLRSEFTK